MFHGIMPLESVAYLVYYLYLIIIDSFESR